MTLVLKPDGKKLKFGGKHWRNGQLGYHTILNQLLFECEKFSRTSSSQIYLTMNQYTNVSCTMFKIISVVKLINTNRFITGKSQNTVVGNKVDLQNLGQQYSYSLMFRIYRMELKYW